MMKIEVLMSTMNKKNIGELNLKDKNINKDITIINQINEIGGYNDLTNNIRMYNYNEKGTSISKNRAIENANGEICILSDDDVGYVKNYDEIIKKKFLENPTADILTFQIITPENEFYKNYIDKEYWHKATTITKVSMIEIVFKRKKVVEKNIKFDLDFGINCRYKNGEENIFMMDCLKKGLKIKYIPIPIVIHPKESSGTLIDEKGLFARGALFFRLYGFKCLIINLIFLIKKMKLIKKRTSLIKAFFEVYKGTFDYVNYKRKGKK